MAYYTVSLQASNSPAAIFYAELLEDETDTGLVAVVTELVKEGKVNGPYDFYCASVHTARAPRESDRKEDVQRLLDEGVDADLGQPWSAIAQASAALTITPSAFDAAQVHQLREAGLDDADIIDVINGAAFFNWANRLMLSLGEPTTGR